jgi:hypothetical protein
MTIHFEKALEAYSGTLQDPTSCLEALEPTAAFLLVERSVHDSSHHLTTHDSQAEASAYHDGDEFPEDWILEKLIDLKTGEEFFAVPSTSWEPMPE